MRMDVDQILLSMEDRKIVIKPYLRRSLSAFLKSDYPSTSRLLVSCLGCQA